MLTAKALKQIVPRAEFAELNKHARYIVKVPSSISMADTERLARHLVAAEIHAVIVVGDHMLFFELDPPPAVPPAPVEIPETVDETVGIVTEFLEETKLNEPQEESTTNLGRCIA